MTPNSGGTRWDSRAFLDPTGGLRQAFETDARPRATSAQSAPSSPVQNRARLVCASLGFVYDISDESKAAAQMNGSPDSSLEISAASLHAASFRRS